MPSLFGEKTGGNCGITLVAKEKTPPDKPVGLKTLLLAPLASPLNPEDGSDKNESHHHEAKSSGIDDYIYPTRPRVTSTGDVSEIILDMGSTPVIHPHLNGVTLMKKTAQRAMKRLLTAITRRKCKVNGVKTRSAPAARLVPLMNNRRIDPVVPIFLGIGQMVKLMLN